MFQEVQCAQLAGVIYKIFLGSLCEALRKDYTNMIVTSLNTPSLCCGCYQTKGSCTDNRGDCVSSNMKENDTSPGEDSITPRQCGQGLYSKEQCKLGRCYTLSAPIEEYSIFYIGSEGRTLSNIIMNYPTCQVRDTNCNMCTHTVLQACAHTAKPLKVTPTCQPVHCLGELIQC